MRFSTISFAPPAWLSEVFAYRDLLVILVWRDVSIRYKQTALGFGWLFIRPLLTTVVLTTVFGRLAGMPSIGTMPYAVVVCAGILPWYFVSQSLQDMSGSLVANSAIITKVYFPRLILPLSSLLVNATDCIISLAVMAVLFAWYGILPGWQILLLPLCFLLAAFVTLGCGLLFAAITVEYRDFRFIVPFVMQVGLYVSPVAFALNVVPENWRLIFSLNPIVGVLEVFRWSLLSGESEVYVPAVIMSAIFGSVMTCIGIIAFQKSEEHLVDII